MPFPAHWRGANSALLSAAVGGIAELAHPAHRRHARPDPSLGLVRTGRQLEQRQGAAHRQECLAALRTRARPAAWSGSGTAATHQLADRAPVSAAAPRPAAGHAAQAAPVIQVDQVGSPPVLTRARRCHSLPHARGTAKWGGRLYRHVRTCQGRRVLYVRAMCTSLGRAVPAACLYPRSAMVRGGRLQAHAELLRDRGQGLRREALLRAAGMSLTLTLSLSPRACCRQRPALLACTGCACTRPALPCSGTASP